MTEGGLVDVFKDESVIVMRVYEGDIEIGLREKLR